MSVIDKLISGLHFNNSADEEGYEEGDYGGYDEEDDPPVEEAPRRRGFFGRKDNNMEEDPPEDNNSYSYNNYNEDPPAPQRAPISRQPVQRTNSMPVPTRRNQSSGSNMQVRIIKPSTFEQASQITDTLLGHRTVLLNLEGLDVNTAQRIVDFASGSCYALHGNFMKISHFIIVITPEDVDIAGDIDSNGGLMGVLGGTSTMGNTTAMPNSAGNAYGAASYNNAGNGTYAGGNTYNFNPGYGSANYNQSSQNTYQNNYGGTAYSNV